MGILMRMTFAPERCRQQRHLPLAFPLEFCQLRASSPDGLAPLFSLHRQACGAPETKSCSQRPTRGSALGLFGRPACWFCQMIWRGMLEELRPCDFFASFSGSCSHLLLVLE